MTYYLTDGTPECFFTAVFVAYNDENCVITSEKDLQIGLGYELKEVTPDGEKAARVVAKLNKTDPLAIEDINLLLRSCDALKEQLAFDYIKLIIKSRAPVRKMLANPTVIQMTELRQKVSGECHLMKGLLRFTESAQGVLYAPFTPDNDVTDLIAPHFASRFANQKFVIHDVKRKKAALYDGNELIMFFAEGAEIYLSEYEKYFEDLWRQYYKSVNIAARPHEKQMKGYMPVRYWKFLPEKK